MLCSPIARKQEGTFNSLWPTTWLVLSIVAPSCKNGPCQHASRVVSYPSHDAFRRSRGWVVLSLLVDPCDDCPAQRLTCFFASELIFCCARVCICADERALVLHKPTSSHQVRPRPFCLHMLLVSVPCVVLDLTCRALFGTEMPRSSLLKCAP